MSNEADRFTDDVQARAHGEDTPDVEGHIRKPHAMNDAPLAGPAEITPSAAEDDGPDVEGHFFRS